MAREVKDVGAEVALLLAEIHKDEHMRTRLNGLPLKPFAKLSFRFMNLYILSDQPGCISGLVVAPNVCVKILFQSRTNLFQFPVRKAFLP